DAEAPTIQLPRRRDDRMGRCMSALGQKQTLIRLLHMSALPPKADIRESKHHVRSVPKGATGFLRLLHRGVLRRLTAPRPKAANGPEPEPQVPRRVGRSGIALTQHPSKGTKRANECPLGRISNEETVAGHGLHFITASNDCSPC